MANITQAHFCYPQAAGKASDTSKPTDSISTECQIALPAVTGGCGALVVLPGIASSLAGTTISVGECGTGIAGVLGVTGAGASAFGISLMVAGGVIVGALIGMIWVYFTRPQDPATSQAGKLDVSTAERDAPKDPEASESFAKLNSKNYPSWQITYIPYAHDAKSLKVTTSATVTLDQLKGAIVQDQLEWSKYNSKEALEDAIANHELEIVVITMNHKYEKGYTVTWYAARSREKVRCCQTIVNGNGPGYCWSNIEDPCRGFQNSGTHLE